MAAEVTFPRLKADQFPVVQFVRHGRIPNYSMDHHITEQGVVEATGRGVALSETLLPDETLYFSSGPARRARQTSAAVMRGVKDASKKALVGRDAVAVYDELENCQCYLNGDRHDLTYPILDAARWLAVQENPPADAAACEEFLYNMWHVTDDAMAYWMAYQGAGAEPAVEAADRLVSFYLQKTSGKAGVLDRYIAVTHSGPLRALLVRIFGHDIGVHMPYADFVTITADGQVYYRGETGRLEL